MGKHDVYYRYKHDVFTDINTVGKHDVYTDINPLMSITDINTVGKHDVYYRYKHDVFTDINTG